MEILAREAGKICEKALYPKFIENYYETAQTMRKNLAILAGAALLLSAACAVALLSMYHYKHRAVRYMVYSVITATILNVAGLFWLKYTDVLQITGVEPGYYQDFLGRFRVQGLSAWYLVSGAGIGIVALLLLLMKRLKHTVK